MTTLFQKGEVSTIKLWAWSPLLSPVNELGLEAVTSSKATRQKTSNCLPINVQHNCVKDHEVYPYLQVELAVVSGPLRGARDAGRTREMHVVASIEITEIKSLLTGRIESGVRKTAKKKSYL